MASVGAFLIALSVLIFIINAVRTPAKPAGLADEDPWDARTLEWTTSCPPPAYNFAETPTVHALDEFWHRKYVEDQEGRLVPRARGCLAARSTAAAAGGHGIHLPRPSFWPLVVSLGFPLMGYGVIYSWWLVGAGVAVTCSSGCIGWALEPSAAE